MRKFFILSLFAFSLFACKNKSSKKTEEPQKEEPVPAPDSTAFKHTRDSVLLGMTNEILTTIKNKDYTALAAFVHPDEGVRFSPYSNIDTTSDKVFSAEWISKQTDRKKQKKVLWGSTDAVGDPINMTIDKYAGSYIYDVDFLHPEKLKVNEIIGHGNTLNNLEAFYKGCDFTESHFSGFDPKYEGMDWRSVRLVFKMKDGKYYLVGVVHDEWTT